VDTVSRVSCATSKSHQIDVTPENEKRIWLRVKELWKSYASGLKRHLKSSYLLPLVFAQTITMGGLNKEIPGRPTAADFAAYCQENLQEDKKFLPPSEALEDQLFTFQR
jgi:hypothetical protein